MEDNRGLKKSLRIVLEKLNQKNRFLSKRVSHLLPVFSFQVAKYCVHIWMSHPKILVILFMKLSLNNWDIYIKNPRKNNMKKMIWICYNYRQLKQVILIICKLYVSWKIVTYKNRIISRRSISKISRRCQLWKYLLNNLIFVHRIFITFYTKYCENPN